jgi:biopolymer transport protein ExbD
MSSPTPVVPSAEPNVTPMIDVLLVLLIVFMIVVVQVHHSMDVVLPQPCATGCDGGDAIVLEILPGPTYRLNGSPIPPANLRARLTSVYAGRPTKIIQVAGVPGVRYDDVMAAMDLAKSAGVTVIGITPRSTARSSR